VNKSQLRKSFLASRDELTPAVRARHSAMIRHRILHHPLWQEAHTFLTYVSFRSEVDTHKLIQEAFLHRKKVVVPTSKADNPIGMSELKAYGDLAPGPTHSIFEPIPRLQIPADPLEIELALIPGVAFDRAGGRIGFGGGHFDRLLAGLPHIQRIGLAFSVQIQDRPLPMEKHDIRMHIVITEKEVIRIS